MHDNVVSTLYHLYLADKPVTTTELAKRVFDPEGTDEVRNADRKVRNYIEDSYPHLVRVEKQNGTKRLSLNEDEIWFGVGAVTVLTTTQEEIQTGLGRVLVYRDEEEEPHVISIEVSADEDDMPDLDADDVPGL